MTKTQAVVSAEGRAVHKSAPAACRLRSLVSDRCAVPLGRRAGKKLFCLRTVGSLAAEEDLEGEVPLNDQSPVRDEQAVVEVSRVEVQAVVGQEVDVGGSIPGPPAASRRPASGHDLEH